ncbi:MAG TPA: MltA domain-containing protein, partial [Oscillatoriaceae cyanobacterium]
MLRPVLLAAVLGTLVLPSTTPPLVPYSDDGDRASLLAGLDHDIAYLSHLQTATLTLAGRPVPVSRLFETAARLRELVEDEFGTPRFAQDVANEFEAVPMDANANQVLFTGYHLPLLDARRQPDATYRYPIYAPPGDLVRVDLGAFEPDLASKTLL